MQGVVRGSVRTGVLLGWLIDEGRSGIGRLVARKGGRVRASLRGQDSPYGSEEKMPMFMACPVGGGSCRERWLTMSRKGERACRRQRYKGFCVEARLRQAGMDRVLGRQGCTTTGSPGRGKDPQGLEDSTKVGEND